MFCFQCEQAKGGHGCDSLGICGKTPEVADLQDILIYQLKGIGFLANKAAQYDAKNNTIDRFVIEALFTTVTNVDFDPDRMLEWIKKADVVRDNAAAMLKKAAATANETVNESEWPPSTTYIAKTTVKDALADVVLINAIGILSTPIDEDIRSLQELLTY